MNALYGSIGGSRQAFNQWKNRQSKKREVTSFICHIIDQVRMDHPGMGVREIWKMMNPPIGRDEFEYLALLHGLGVQRRRNYRKTTDSRGVKRFPNLLKKEKAKHMNQIWVSDITYYRLANRFCYLSFILDLFSRKAIGFSVSKTLKALDTVIPAFKYAIKMRGPLIKTAKKIFHSDGGGQFYSNEFIRLTGHYGFKNSMAKTVYENPVIERFHATIKNQYIYLYQPRTFEELKLQTARACLNYNLKPHKALGQMTPHGFEESILNRT